MKELTTEERLQVFMLYPNAHILYAKGEWHLSGWDPYGIPSLYLTNTGMSIWPECNVEGSEKIAKCQLILKSLEEITEEDKREFGEYWLSLTSKDTSKFSRDVFLLVAERILEDPFIDYRAADFLRPNNYALPFKGVDLFDAGIAVKQ